MGSQGPVKAGIPMDSLPMERGGAAVQRRRSSKTGGPAEQPADGSAELEAPDVPWSRSAEVPQAPWEPISETGLSEESMGSSEGSSQHHEESNPWKNVDLTEEEQRKMWWLKENQAEQSQLAPEASEQPGQKKRVKTKSRRARQTE